MYKFIYTSVFGLSATLTFFSRLLRFQPRCEIALKKLQRYSASLTNTLSSPISPYPMTTSRFLSSFFSTTFNEGKGRLGGSIARRARLASSVVFERF